MASSSHFFGELRGESRSPRGCLRIPLTTSTNQVAFVVNIHRSAYAVSSDEKSLPNFLLLGDSY